MTSKEATSKCKVITIHKASEVPLKPIDGKPTLVYWDIVGLAHPLRMALALADIEWVDVRIVCGRSSDNDVAANKKEWFQAKPSLREEKILDFPNLPYYLDEQVSLVQSHAILRYLGNKYSLMGKNATTTSSSNNNAPEYMIDMLLEEARDLDSTLIKLSYEQGADAVAKWLNSEGLRQNLSVWDDYIQKTGAFVFGEKLTVVDLQLYTFAYKFQHAQAELMVSSPMTDEAEVPALPFWIPAYLEQVESATPQLQAYLNSPDMKIPMNNPHARFDNF